MKERTFQVEPARRERTIVTVGFVGYSGSGKTVSLLRFAAGMQEAIGGRTALVDSNLKRSLYYAPRPGEKPVRGQTFDFDHVHFTPPFDPPSCRAAFQVAIDRGATRILWDCASDEWEGQGGVLDMHDRAIDEMIDRKRDKGSNEPDWKLRDRLSNTAWIKVKRAHLELRLWMWQQPVDWLISFRAKQKVDVAKQSKSSGAAAGKSKDRDDKDERSWQPIGSDELVYDLMLRCLLPPGSDGTPNWTPVTEKEKLLVKPPPGPIRELLRAHPQVNEELGYQIARWATGHDIEIRPTRPAPASGAAPAASSPTATSSRTTSAPPAGRPLAAVLVERYDACTSRETLELIKADARASWESIPRGAPRSDVAEAFKRAESRLAADTGSPPPVDDTEASEIRAAEAAHNHDEGADRAP